ncbi:hypothetical protein L9F63_012715, partial [Diploptera punctata]
QLRQLNPFLIFLTAHFALTFSLLSRSHKPFPTILRFSIFSFYCVYAICTKLASCLLMGDFCTTKDFL